MAIRKISLIPGEYYHIYNRGNSKQNIFLDQEDYKRFTQCLFVCNTEKSFNFRDNIVRAGIEALDFDRGETPVSIGAWVLMPNHFHIYLTPSSDLGKNKGVKRNAVSEFMRKLSTSYASYFNAKYKRTGGLFEGGFKAKHVTKDGVAKYLFSYIHLNPIKLIDPAWKEQGVKDVKKAAGFLGEYRWSSYLDYKGLVRKENSIITKTDFPPYFQNEKGFNMVIKDWLLSKINA